MRDREDGAGECAVGCAVGCERSERIRAAVRPTSRRFGNGRRARAACDVWPCAGPTHSDSERKTRSETCTGSSFRTLRNLIFQLFFGYLLVAIFFHFFLPVTRATTHRIAANRQARKPRHRNFIARSRCRRRRLRRTSPANRHPATVPRGPRPCLTVSHLAVQYTSLSIFLSTLRCHY